MPIDILKTLKTGKSFSELNEDALRKIISKFQKIYLHKGAKVFSQGEPSDGIFLLLTGKLITILTKDKRLEKIVTFVHPGDTIGEMGAFSHEPRTTTVKAVENSIALKLSSEAYRELCNAYPSIIIQAMNILAKRSHSIIDTLSRDRVKKKHIAVLPANESVPIEKFYRGIQEQMAASVEVALLSDYDCALNEEKNNDTKLAQLILEHSNNEKLIIYFLNAYETPLARACFENVDMIYLVADGQLKPQLTDYVFDKLNSYTAKAKPELILIHQNKVQQPHNTSKWLKLADFQFNHHLRMYQAKDFQRLSRFMLGKAVGLVLGGGGIRSWAHMGVIKALMDLKVPIDFIGGASGGTIVGGYFALHETYKDPREVLRALSVATVNTLSLTSLTWPAISLTDSKQYTEKLQKVFGKLRIENLWLPFFCVSCRLEKNSAVVQRRGLLWEKIRSSTSIPGVFPPVVLKGKLYLDGGIVNNLPVDLMKKLSDSIDTVIAVELIHNSPEEKRYNFPPILPFWKVILAKLGLAYRSYKFPHFIDTFLKSLLVGSSVKQRENALAADILIQPDLSKFHLLNISRKQELELIEIGYRATLKALKKAKWLKDR